MAVQVKRAGAAEYGRWVKMLVCGDPGSGKTRSASTWPNPLYLSVEGGLMSVADRQMPFVEIEHSNQVLEIKQQLDQTPEVREKMLGVPVDTVIIDTIDHLARLLVAERLDEQRKETLAIQDWGWLGDQLRGVVRSFRNLEMHVIFNCHIKSTEDSETGRVFHKPGIQGAMGDEIAAYVDLAVLLTARPVTKVIDGKNVKEIVRVFQTFPDANHPWVKDRSGKLPLEFGINFDNDYKRLDEFVYGSVPAAGATVTGAVQPLVATPDAPTAPAPTAPTAVPAKEKAPPAEPVADPTPAAPAPGPEAAPTPPESAPAPSAPVAPEPPAEAPAETKQPEPAPEAAPPAAEPAAEPEAENPGTAPGPAVGPPPEESVSDADTASAEAWATCQVCGGATENKDQADLAFIRFRKFMCRKCFAEAKKK